MGDDLINVVAKAHPTLVDAKYTKGTSQRADALRRDPAAPQVKMEDHCAYRFLLDIRGVTASFRFRHLFLCRSLVFHVVAEPEWLEWFHAGLVPWVHYVPVKKDFSDLASKVQWALDNDDMAEQIAETGFAFVRDRMRSEDVTEYFSKLLQTYANLQRWSPKLGADMKEVQPTSATLEQLRNI